MKHVTNAVEKEIVVGVPAGLVWYAWTMSDRVCQWFAPEVIIEPKDGGAYELYFVPGNKTGMNTRGCKILSLIAEKELIFQWKGPDQFQHLMNKENELTTVHVNIESIDDSHSKVSIKHSGFLDGQAWDEAEKWHEMAWAGVLSSLKTAMETGKGELCCQPE